MLTKRIIPCLDIMHGKVVKGIRFKNLRDAGDPPELAAFYEEEGADEIVFLDIAASYEERKILLDVATRTAETISIPFTIGGGIRSIEDIRKILLAGADKVSINTAAVENSNLIKEASEKFGSQCIVVSIDAKRVYDKLFDDKNISKINEKACWWEVYTYGARKSTGKDAISWAEEVEKLGAGEILLTSIDYDGTKNGYDIPLTREVCKRVKIPVIASGGAGSPEHIYEVLTQGMADAALAASIFHFKEYSIKEVKEFLYRKGVKVRFL
ncbi:MAG: imidazole glycerol phosphate synthase subunit HisF [Candidatus Bathyarchaeia archaeon]